MNAPEAIREIAAECAARNLSDIESALDCLLARIRGLPDFATWRDTLVRQCCRELIYAARHALKTQMRRDTGQYGAPARVVPGEETVAVTVRSLFDYPMNGRRLGDLRYSELETVAAAQEAIAHGHLFNARLCRELFRLMPRPRRGQDPTVQERVQENDLNRLFNELNPPPGLADAGH